MVCRLSPRGSPQSTAASAHARRTEAVAVREPYFFSSECPFEDCPPAPIAPPPTGANGTVEADTYVNTASPTRNYGTAVVTKLHSPVTAEYRPLVRFSLSGPPAAPQSGWDLALHLCPAGRAR